MSSCAWWSTSGTGSARTGARFTSVMRTRKASFRITVRSRSGKAAPGSWSKLASRVSPIEPRDGHPTYRKMPLRQRSLRHAAPCGRAIGAARRSAGSLAGEHQTARPGQCPRGSGASQGQGQDRARSKRVQLRLSEYPGVALPGRSPTERRRSAQRLPGRCGSPPPVQCSGCTADQRYCPSPTVSKSRCRLPSGISPRNPNTFLIRTFFAKPRISVSRPGLKRNNTPLQPDSLGLIRPVAEHALFRAPPTSSANRHQPVTPRDAATPRRTPAAGNSPPPR